MDLAVDVELEAARAGQGGPREQPVRLFAEVAGGVARAQRQARRGRGRGGRGGAAGGRGAARLGLLDLLQRAGAAPWLVVLGRQHGRQRGARVQPQQQQHGARVLHDVLRHEVQERLRLRAPVDLRLLRRERTLLL